MSNVDLKDAPRTEKKCQDYLNVNWYSSVWWRSVTGSHGSRN